MDNTIYKYIVYYWLFIAAEVDIIVKSPSYNIPVEVKYRETADLKEKDGIVRYCRKEKVRFAYWVTQKDQDFEAVQFKGLETKFLKIPAHIFIYLLGQSERLLWAEWQKSLTVSERRAPCSQ